MNRKRIVALVAAGLLGVQLMGVGTASAGSGGTSECDFNDDSLEITLGDDFDVYLQIDGTILECDVNGSVEDQALSTIKAISVAMDDEEDSTSELYIYLDDDTSTDAVDWPRFQSFDIDVYTELHIDGTSVGSGQGNLRVAVGKSTVSFQGATATLGALVPSIEIDGGPNRDTLDGTGAVVTLDIDGDAGADTIKGGTKRDYLDASDGGNDAVYGGPGNDDILCGGGDYDAGWGQDGEDFIDSCWATGPGAGDDEVANTTVSRLYYTDVAGDSAVILSSAFGGDCGDDADISGAIGVDIMPTSMDLDRLYMGSGNDYVYNDGCIEHKLFMGAGNDRVRDYDGIGNGDRAEGVFGEAGNDVLHGANAEYDALHGGPGDDRMYGYTYPDVLIGGGGNDQAWCGSAPNDFAKSSEVMNSCENFTFYVI